MRNLVSCICIFVAASCAPAESSEGEGEGDDPSKTAGGVTFSSTEFSAVHASATSDCPQDVDAFTLTNGSGEERVVNFALSSANLRLTDDAGGELAFVSLATDAEFEVRIVFTCAANATFEEDIVATVTEADAVTEVGEVTLTVAVEIDG